MLEYRKSLRNEHKNGTSFALSKLSTRRADDSARSQTTGLAYLHDLKLKLQRSTSLASVALSPSDMQHSPSTGPATDVVDVEDDETEGSTLDERDKAAVAEEFQHYIAEGVLKRLEYRDFSLTRYWQVSLYLGLQFNHYLLILYLYYSRKSISFLPCTMLRLIFCLFKRLLWPASGCSHQVKKQSQCVAMGSLQS